MSRSKKSTGAMLKLLEILDLEQLEHNLFRGNSPQVGWQRVFGGQVIGQALVAAQRTVSEPKHVHSLHAYFMRGGDPAVPIIYEVDRIRDGVSFATRRVVAIQHGHAIFSLSASFHVDEDGYDHQIDMPKIPMPEMLIGEKEIAEHMSDSVPENIKKYWQKERAIEIRPTSLAHYFSREKLDPVQNVWVQTTGDVPDSRPLQAAILAYLSDMTLLDTALYAHGSSVFEPGLQVASLDHAMWFHRPCKLDDWLLYVQDSPNANGARGLTRGGLYTREGVLVASVAQEGLIRKKKKPNK